MAEETPRVYLFYGDDEFGTATEIGALKSRLGEGITAEMNASFLDGTTVDFEEMRSLALTAPFLASRRLVIVANPLKRLRKGAERDRFIQILENIPASTALVIQESSVLDADHWFLRWTETQGGTAYARKYGLPKGAEMARWIREEAEKAGGAFTPQAANLLAALVGSDKRHAFQEIEKMLAFVNFNRPVENDDVELLAASLDQVESNQVFKMVDALGLQNPREALDHLHQLLVERDPLSLFGMIVRQFRLLLLAREVLDRGGGANEVKKATGVHSFVAGKISAQAKNFDRVTLRTIYRHLLALDEDIKIGAIPAETALDMLVASFTPRPR